MASPLQVAVHAESAIVMNADTGAILYEKNAHTLQYPASITKIATALYALRVQRHDLDVPVTAERESVASVSEEAKKRSSYTLPAYWLVHDGMHIGIKAGEVLTLRDLLFGMMIASGNDAANVIAQYVGGTIPGFMEEVNSYLKSIGCHNTHFCNPHGLHHPKHLTTAYDMALMTREALKDKEFRMMVKTVKYTRPKTNKQNPTTLVQTNKMIRSGRKVYYPKAIGVKTGYHAAAQNTYVAAAESDGRTLIAVLIKVKDRDDCYHDAKKLFEAAFAQSPMRRVLLKAGPQKYQLKIDGAARVVQTYIDTDVCADFFPAEEPNFKCKLFWKEVQLPIVKGQHVGNLQLSTEEGRIVQTVPIYAKDDVGRSWGYAFKQLFRSDPKVEGMSDNAGFAPIWKSAVIMMAFTLLAGFLFLIRR
ncbi:MAG: D-alanyl-D-alanine carboxypeptidase [Chlamydiia bacterium]|nr:D-alanyl-D-alanine carboxypeptidase [Chlamydiia bacterium]